MAKFQSVCLALPMLMISSVDEAGEPRGAGAVQSASQQPQQHQGTHLRLASTLGELLGHPVFAGFAQRLLPWGDNVYDLTMPLSQIGCLLPYHSHVEPADAVAGLNRLINEVQLGRPVFFDIYTPAQKQADPTKQHTGLFLLRGKPGAPFAVIAPGGGFAYVASLHEGLPYAMEISQAGYNAFVLKYRVGQGGQVATEDLAAALDFIQRHAQALGVSPNHYALWGSSAGARMAASIGSYGVEAFGGGAELPRPETVVMAYTGHSDYRPVEPPTFVVVGEQDSIASPTTMARRVDQLRRTGTSVEFHRYPGLGHGFGLGTGTTAEGWIRQAIGFWTQQISN